MGSAAAMREITCLLNKNRQKGLFVNLNPTELLIKCCKIVPFCDLIIFLKLLFMVYLVKSNFPSSFANDEKGVNQIKCQATASYVMMSILFRSLGLIIVTESHYTIFPEHGIILTVSKNLLTWARPRTILLLGKRNLLSGIWSSGTLFIFLPDQIPVFGGA
jgi:hypothetical protein